MSDILTQAAEFTSQFEGFSAVPYVGLDLGNETFGYGSVVKYHPEQVFPISEADAKAILAQDLSLAYKSVINSVKVDITDNQTIALIDFAYNCGIGAFEGSTLLQLLNAGAENIAVANQFLRWNKCAGQVVEGLTKRRQAEKDLFLS